MKGRNAFTLIELLVVISIIALLSSVVLASLNSARAKGKLAAAKSFSASLDHVLGDQAVGIWDLDECSGSIVKDRSGYGYDGTFTGSPTWSTDTPNGQGCSLSVTNGQGFTVPDNANLDIGLGSATRSIWFKTTQASASLIRKSDSSNVNGIIMYLSGGTIYCQVGVNGGPEAVAQGSTVYNDGVWHHAACVLDRTANTLSVYGDGSFQAKGDASPVSALNLDAGSAISVPTPYFDSTMLLDGMRFYNKALTAFDVRRIYAFGKNAAPVAVR